MAGKLLAVGKEWHMTWILARCCQELQKIQFVRANRVKHAIKGECSSSVFKTKMGNLSKQNSNR